MSAFSFSVLTFVIRLLLHVPFITSQAVPGASFFLGGGAPGSGAYELVDDYEPSTFFDKFYYDSVMGSTVTMATLIADRQ